MPSVISVWRDFVSNLMKETFGEFLTENEINERTDWILSNLNKIQPETLYKNIIYMMSNNAISEIAIGYKLKFMTGDWKELINNPVSEEFDSNENLTPEENQILLDIIDHFGDVINHHIEMLIHDKNYNSQKSITDLLNTFIELNDFYNLPKYEAMHHMYVHVDSVVYTFDIGQILYFAVFDKNPINGEPCPDELKDSVKSMYKSRVMMMEALKKSWPEGIDLKYVQSTKIF